jgi:sugar lactone lactonase YvrE
LTQVIVHEYVTTIINDLFTGWPNGLCIDFLEERLYWADAKFDRIEASDFNGQHRFQLIDQIYHPFGLAVVSIYVCIDN